MRCRSWILLAFPLLRSRLKQARTGPQELTIGEKLSEQLLL